MKNKKCIIVTLIYFALCLIISFQRIPFWDEARAWLISANSNPAEFLDLMKLECHLFPWYLIIFPFAKLNIFYPYSIYTINALFASGAVFLLLKYSKFSFTQKLLITFSTPFLFLWGTVARCYSVGILFLFLALSIYKIRFKKPYIYTVFLSLSLNTSVMAFIGSFFLLIIFLFENRKNKNFYKILLIFLFACSVVAFQIFSFSPDYLRQLPEMGFLRDFLGFIFRPVFFIKQYPIQSTLMSLLRTACIVCAFVFCYFCTKNNKKVLFFILSTYFSMIVLFTFFYSGNFWHYFYFYLYFVTAFWILKEENKISKILNMCFYIILSLCIFKGSMFIDSKLTTINDSKSKYIAQIILENPVFKNKKLFCLDPWSDIAPASLPYLKNVNIYDKNNIERKSPKSMRKQIEFNLSQFDPDNFIKHVENNSILLTNQSFFNHEKNNPLLTKNNDSFIFKGDKSTIIFKPFYKNPDILFWAYTIEVNK